MQIQETLNKYRKYFKSSIAPDGDIQYAFAYSILDAQTPSFFLAERNEGVFVYFGRTFFRLRDNVNVNLFLSQLISSIITTGSFDISSFEPRFEDFSYSQWIKLGRQRLQEVNIKHGWLPIDESVNSNLWSKFYQVGDIKGKRINERIYLPIGVDMCSSISITSMFQRFNHSTGFESYESANREFIIRVLSTAKAYSPDSQLFFLTENANGFHVFPNGNYNTFQFPAIVLPLYKNSIIVNISLNSGFISDLYNTQIVIFGDFLRDFGMFADFIDNVQPPPPAAQCQNDSLPSLT